MSQLSESPLAATQPTAAAASCLPKAHASAPAMLREFARDLGAINISVAENFLALAAVLQANAKLARKIADTSHISTGSKSLTSIRQLTEMLQHILDDASGISAMVDNSAERMSGILNHIVQSAGPLARLSQVRPVLQIIGVLSRIEGVRFHDGTVDLASLSSDIAALAADTQKQLESVHEESSTLRKLVTRGLTQLGDFSRQERVAIADLIQQTEALLGPALVRAEAAQAAARGIDEEYLEFQRSTSVSVMALQSEDLARQRVEHIQTVLTGTARQLETGDAIESCAAMLLLQRAQLASTRDLLGESILSIQTGLLAIPFQIQHLVERTSELSHQSVGDGEAFLALVSGSQSTVVDVFNRCCTCARSVVSIVENLTPAVRRMTAGASALEHIQTLILLLAINAAIKTEHLGPDGASMGVLATEMQDLARRSEGDTAFVLEQLNSMSQILTDITGEQSVSQGTHILAEGSERAVETQLSSLSGAVQSSSREMTESLEQVLQLAALLCADAKQGSELASRAHSLMDCFKQQLEHFDHIFEQLGIDRELAAAYGRAHQGGEISNLYSMQSERDLHLEIFGSPAGDSPAASTSSEFGDGVELF
jgi:hypothetical protein